MKVAFFSCFLEPGILQGRVVANRSFLRALLEGGKGISLYFFLGSVFEKQNFLNSYGRWKERFEIFSREDVIGIGWHNTVIHQPDLAWDEVLYLRENVFAEHVPISCFTHSISYPSLLNKFVTALSCLSFKDRIICSSPTAKIIVKQASKLVGMEIPDDLIRIVPLGVPLDYMDQLREKVDVGRLRKELGIENKAVFLCFGRISEFSKADLFGLLKVCFRIAKHRRDFVVFIAGDTSESNYAEYIRSIVSIWKIEDVVKVICNPNEEKKHILFSVSDVFVALSDNFQETFGQVLLEAMAYNMPIIATDWGGFRDVLSDYPNWMKVETFCFDGVEEILSVYEKISYEMLLHLYWASCIWLDLGKLERYMTLCIEEVCGRGYLPMDKEAHIDNKWNWNILIGEYISCWEEMLKSKNQRLFGDRKTVDISGEIGRIFFDIYPSFRLDYRKDLICNVMDKELLEKGTGLHSELRERLDGLRIKSFLEETDGNILLEDLVRSVGIWEASWMLKQGWVQIEGAIG